MIEDLAIPKEVREAALTVSNYAKMQGWSGNWCIADVCSRETIDNLNKEIKQWKANHDNQVKLKSILIQRPDLKDRANRMSKFIEENQKLQTRLGELISSYEADLKQFEEGYIYFENELDFYMQKGKMSKLEDIVSELKQLLQ